MAMLFVASDIHAHAKILKKALKKAKYDPRDDTHELLILGDLFDRGKESKEVYELLKPLKDLGKAEMILGNHDLFLLDFLEGRHEKVLFNIEHNGFEETLTSFSGMQVKSFEDLAQIQETILTTYPDLLDFLKSLPLYIEHEGYIFTHGGVDTTLDDWKAQPRDKFVWNYQNKLPYVPGKTIVVGHQRVDQLRRRREHNPKKNKERFAPIKETGKLFIDGNVEKSGVINVVKIPLSQSLLGKL